MEDKQPRKAVALVSGGLDSMLAVKVVQELRTLVNNAPRLLLKVELLRSRPTRTSGSRPYTQLHQVWHSVQDTPLFC